MAICRANANWTSVTLEVNERNININNNTSIVDWSLYIDRTYNINSSVSKSGQVYIDGGLVWSGNNTIGGSGHKVLATGSRVIGHDSNGSKAISFSFSQQLNVTLSGTYYGTLSSSGSLGLTNIPRQANITNLPASFNDEENPWFDYSNPGNFSLKAWLEPNPSGPHYCVRTFSGTGGRFNWDLSESERKQLRQACKGNSCTVRVGLYSNGETWHNFHDRKYNIINANPIIPDKAITYITTNYQELTGDDKTVIKGFSSLDVNISAATPLKEATLSYYKVTIGEVINHKTSLENPFVLENITTNTINLEVGDSRSNVSKQELSIDNLINYTAPKITSIGFNRSEGGIGTNVTLSYEGTMWEGNFGITNNEVRAKYYYKEQGSSQWIEGSSNINPSSAANFNKSILIKGDLGADGFNAGKNYDFKLVVQDKVTDNNKETILFSGIPRVAYHQEGVAFGAFYDPEVGGSLQVDGKDISKLHNFTYSNEEQWMGSYWLDGKKIFQKTVALKFANNSTSNTKHEISDLGKVIKRELMWYDTTDKRWYNESRYDDGNNICIKITGISATEISAACKGTDWQGRTSNRYITLYYTKAME